MITCTHTRRNQSSHTSRQAGFTLIELMVALVLGLFLIGGVISLFVSNQSNYRVSENLSRLQESSRFSVELLSREIREAGTTPCGVRAINNVIREGGTAETSIPWWSDWNSGTVRGFEGTTTLTGFNSVPFGTGTGTRVINTDAIMTLRTAMEEEALHVVQAHNTATTVITLDRTPTEYKDGQAVVMCDSKSAALFHLTQDAAGTSAQYDNLGRMNCSTLLGWAPSVSCNSTATHKQFSPGAFFVKYDPAFWYVGNSSADGRTGLYRATMVVGTVSGNRVPTIQRREMVPDVSDMQIQYLTRTNPASSTGTAVLSSTWVNADDAKFATLSGGWSPANVNEAIAARITLTMTSKENVGTSAGGNTSQRLTRQSVFLVNLRNREVVPIK
jgi:type IV pilus assembly protein PilW